MPAERLVWLAGLRWPTSYMVRETLRLQKRPSLTVPQTCLLVDAVLTRTGSPADRAHAQCQRRYCAYLFRQYEVSLHY